MVTAWLLPALAAGCGHTATRVVRVGRAELRQLRIVEVELADHAEEMSSTPYAENACDPPLGVFWISRDSWPYFAG